MKQIYSARDEIDAEMVKNALADAEIESVVQSGAFSAVLRAIPVTEGSLPSVWVRDEDVDRATKVLAEFQQPPKPARRSLEMPQVRRNDRPAIHRVLELRNDAGGVKVSKALY